MTARPPGSAIPALTWGLLRSGRDSNPPDTCMPGCFQGLLKTGLYPGGAGQRTNHTARRRPLTPLWRTRNGHVTGTLEPGGQDAI
jgi:hypothetical protein